MRRIGAVWHRVRQYVKQDLRETLLPSSIPDPPGYVPPPPLTLRDKARRVAHVCRAYIDTWSSAKLQAELVRRQPERAKEFAAAKDDTGEERLSDIMAELGEQREEGCGWCCCHDRADPHVHHQLGLSVTGGLMCRHSRSWRGAGHEAHPAAAVHHTGCSLSTGCAAVHRGLQGGVQGSSSARA